MEHVTGKSATAAARTAAGLHGQGYNCAESVLTGVLAQFPGPRLASRVATAFGGGIGRTGDVCGAVTGAVMAISWLRGRDSAEDKESYVRCAALVRAFLQDFRKAHGTLVCGELTGYDLSDPAVLDKFMADAERRAKCERFVETAARLAASALDQSPPGHGG